MPTVRAASVPSIGRADSMLSFLLLIPLCALVFGVLADDSMGALAGAIAGFTCAWAFVLRARLQRLERRLDALEAVTRKQEGDGVSVAPVTATVAAEPEWDTPFVSAVAAEQAQPVIDNAPAWMDGRVDSATAAAAEGPWAQEQAQAMPGSLSIAWQWLSGGNTLVRTGIIVLFFGAAFLIRYVAQHSTISIEIRLAAIAVAGVGLVMLGLRLARTRKGYGLSLQGGGLGLIYLVLFGAMQFYGLLAPLLGFVALFVCTLIGVGLGLRQNAQALAVLAVLGGFLAPVLVSAGGGDHVRLFGYYLVLDLGIAAVAFWRIWRLLNLVGFLCTFVIGALWGGLRYRAELFSSTEPFLVIFFVLFSALPLLSARRLPLDLRRPLDTTLVFGVPVVSFALQAALVGEFVHGLSWSACGAALWYALLDRLARVSPAFELLADCYRVLAIIAATIAIPLAFDDASASPLWALEGAGLLWIACRQRRVVLWWLGILIQVGAACLWGRAYLFDAVSATRPFLNVAALDTALIALAGLCSAWVTQRYGTVRGSSVIVTRVFACWGWLWWLVFGSRETFGLMVLRDASGAWLLFLALSALVGHQLARRNAWPDGRLPALALPLLFIFALLFDFQWRSHSLAGLGLLGWPCAFGVQLWLLYREELELPARRDQRWRHALTACLLLALGAEEIRWLVGEAYGLGRTWIEAALGLWLAGGIVWLASARWPAWPLAARAMDYRRLALPAVFVASVLWSLLAGLQGTADPAPLAYLPLLNPLELAQLAVLVAMRHCGLQCCDSAAWPQRWRRPLLWSVGLLGFAMLNVLVLRGCHHLAGVPWAPLAMLDSRVVQAALAAVWAVSAVVLMLAGARGAQRQRWLSGAALMGLTVLKLFLVDLSGRDTLERIVAFLVVGILLLLVGYFAPAPPRSGSAGDADNLRSDSPH